MKNRALMIIDLQIGLESDTNKLADLTSVITTVNQRIATYRQLGLPIIFIQHEEPDLLFETPAWQLFPTLDASSTDYYIRKTHANSFYQTTLQSLLLELKIDTLEFCGAQVEYCVDTTIRMAHGLGYTCFMKKGTVTTLDTELLTADVIRQHHEAIWDNRFLTFF